MSMSLYLGEENDKEEKGRKPPGEKFDPVPSDLTKTCVFVRLVIFLHILMLHHSSIQPQYT